MKYIKTFLMLLLCMATFASGAEKVAAVIKIKGAVAVRPAKEKIYKQSYVGQVLYDGDWIKTNGDEFAAIVFMDGSQLKIREMTELEIRAKAVSQGVLNTDLYLTEGEVWTKVQKQKGDFKIQTPVSVASVKGTEFDLLYEKIENFSDLFVISGSVEFSNELGTILAKEMTHSRIVPEEKPTRVAKLKSSDVPEWKDSIEPNWGFNIIPEKQGKLPIGQVVNVTVQIMDISQNRINTRYSGAISVDTESPSLKVGFGGGTFGDNAKIPIEKGSGSFAVQGLAQGSFSCLIAMPEGESRKIVFDFQGTAEQNVKIERKVEKLGSTEKLSKISDLSENRTLKNVSVSGAGETADQVLDKVDKGEYKIRDMIEIENADGSITLKIIVESK
jgi:hypothetical protein